MRHGRVPGTLAMAAALAACGENQLHSLDTSDTAAQGGSSDNQAPSAPEVRIMPPSPSPSEDLLCQRIQDSVDPEGQTVTYQISWEKDGQPTSQATDRVAAELTSADQSWVCIQIASDGQRESLPGRDTVLIVQENRPPEAPEVRISPSAPGENHGLECLVIEESDDPDGDTVVYSYAWTVNGESSDQVDAVVSSEQTSQGDSWTCTVTPSDGELEGESASDGF